MSFLIFGSVGQTGGGLPCKKYHPATFLPAVLFRELSLLQ